MFTLIQQIVYTTRMKSNGRCLHSIAVKTMVKRVTGKWLSEEAYGITGYGK